MEHQRMETPKCQIYCVEPMSEGVIRFRPKSVIQWAKVMLHRTLSPERKRAIKMFVDRLRKRFGSAPEAPPSVAQTTTHLHQGDLVRVRSWEEIEATLGAFRSLKGLAFMPEMEPYIGTTQRVFKVLTRFFDERDYKIRHAKGIVLLDGVMCEGTTIFGPCDRSCFFFWREEWLEKLDTAPEEEVVRH